MRESEDDATVAGYVKGDDDRAYARFVESLMRSTADRLEGTSSDDSAMRSTILRYVESARNSELSWGELIDFFCVTEDSIVERAYPREADRDVAVAILDEIGPAIYFGDAGHN